MIKTKNKGFTDADVEFIKTEYPAAYAAFAKWSGDFDIPVPEEVTKLVRSVTDMLVNTYLRASTRDLYDFFDEQGIYGNIVAVGNTADMLVYCSSSKSPAALENSIPAEGDCTARVMAERKMFLESFKLLESKLNGKGIQDE